MEELNNREDLEQLLSTYKKALDFAYTATKTKYGKNTACGAMFEYITKNNTLGFTRDNGARSIVEKLNYHYNELFQIISDYIISTYMLTEVPVSMTEDKAFEYSKDTENKLNYSKEKVIEAAAIMIATSPYMFMTTLAMNKTLKYIIAEAFVRERYLENKKDKLDNTRNSKLLSLPDGQKLMLSKHKLNISIRTMNDDDGIENKPFTR